MSEKVEAVKKQIREAKTFREGFNIIMDLWSAVERDEVSTEEVEELADFFKEESEEARRRFEEANRK